MAKNSIYLDAPVDSAYETLLDPLCYPEWVVGAKKIRAVDEGWPQVGSSFHHKVRVAGRDRSEMLENEPGRRVVLKVFARPVLVAIVSLDLDRAGSGTNVTMTEEPAPDTLMRKIKLLIDPLVYLRNTFALRSFKKVVEARAAQGGSRA
jgi:uncharacterized protein YndB with AHSA1/START domain